MSEGRHLVSGNQAVAMAALDAGVVLGTGYPGTPSTEILESFSAIGGRAQWAPNEKVAFEVGLGAAFAGARTLVTMKHVGVNVAADPLFTAAYTGVTGAMVLISADDPGMHSSQNEQDNRNYAKAAGIPTLEPADSQETYELFHKAIEISEKWGTVVMLRMTTRVCHSKGIVRPFAQKQQGQAPNFVRDIASRLMLPGYARPAHRRLRAKLAEIEAWANESDVNQRIGDNASLGIISAGVTALHVQEAVPEASLLKLGMTYPLPIEKIRQFRASVERCIVIEEGDPFFTEALRAAGIDVETKDEMYRFGELNVGRVKRILAGDTTPEEGEPPGRPPQLCSDCPHRAVFGTLSELDCIVAGDIGCYTLGGRPPFDAMDTCVCMGASVGVGLGLRHVLPEDQAKRVVSVIGDSTFVHSGVTGLIEMVYNAPPGGHVLIVVDNGTTAMTGMQEHPGTGRSLDHKRSRKVSFEDLAKSVGIDKVHVIDPASDREGFKKLVTESLDSKDLVLIITRRPCSLAVPKLEAYEKAIAEGN